MSETTQTPCSSTTPQAACGSCPLLGRLEQVLAPKKPFCKRRPILSVLLLLLTLFVVWKAGNFFFKDPDAESFVKGKRIAVVRIEGMILENKQLTKWIDKIKRDPNIKGVLLRIDSPGGGAAASQEIFEMLQSVGEKKPIVASMGTVAASGGLMIAMAAKHIVANPSTITGSIGVRISLPQIYGLMDKIGVGQESITTGKYKNAGSPFRPLQEYEREYFSGLIQDMYKQFVKMVATSRNIPEDKVLLMADGRAFTGREAKDLGLVDELGSQYVALRHLRTLCDADPSAPLLEQPKSRNFLRMLAETFLELDLSTRYRAPDFMFVF